MNTQSEQALEPKLTPLMSFMANYGIWLFAFGYFASYVPYSALIKLLTEVGLPGMSPDMKWSSLQVLPLSAIGAVFGMIIFLSIMRWWKHANHVQFLGMSIPVPSKWTFLSGCCSTFIIATTTLSYAFPGVSIVLVMLLMRGGLLILGPVIDFMRKRKVRWYSWAAFFLSFIAVFLPFLAKGGGVLPLACMINIAIYLLGYFIRLNVMSSKAKSEDSNANIKYFVEEQITSSPMLVLVLAVAACFAGTGNPQIVAIKDGFTAVVNNPYWIWVLVTGLFSAGTGVFGGLILLDKSENTYCIPVNRCSSIIAGLLASYIVYLFGGKLPATYQVVGALIIIAAILFLALPPLFEKKKKAKEA